MRACGVRADTTKAAWKLRSRNADAGEDYLKEIEENERKSRSKDAKPMIGIGDKLKITKVEPFLVKPRWLFLKIHTNAGIVGLYAIIAQVFPTHVRAFGTGFTIGVGRGGSVLAPIDAPSNSM